MPNQPPIGADRQRGRVALRIGKRSRIVVTADISSTGFLAIGSLVAMTLLSTAVLVRVATDADARQGARLPAAS